MKLITVIALCLLSLVMRAQQPGNVSAKPDIYVYNKGTDTIFLTKVKLGPWDYCGNVKVVDSIQIDGNGAKEMVFFRTGSYASSEHGGSFDYRQSEGIAKYEIWNLDTKQLVFQAVSARSFHFSGFRAGWNPERKEIDEQYKYDFFINPLGAIKIDNFCGSKDAKPDLIVGTYKFENGKYSIVNQ